MNDPIKTAIHNIMLKMKKLEKDLEESRQFLTKLSEMSGVPTEKIFRYYKYNNLLNEDEDEDEDEIIDSGRPISQENLENLVISIIYGNPSRQCDVEEILDTLKFRQYDPGGRNKRKNLTTRLWRLCERNKKIVRFNDGVYGLSDYPSVHLIER